MSASAAAAKPLRLVLVGDSTVTERSGWGLGFKRFVGDGLVSTNLAVGGRSTLSYRFEGRWDNALALKADYYLIQFGHNNQPGKPGRSTDMPTFVADMERYVDEVRAIGAQPILVTPLVRRRWSKTDPTRIDSDLIPYAEAVRKIAAKKRVPVLELHDRALALCEKLGREGCLAFSPRKVADGTESVDNTHLTADGSLPFAEIVADELRRAVPELAAYLRAEPLPVSAVQVRMAAPWGTEAIAPIKAPFAIAELERPLFPDRTFDIRDHGAVEGGEVKNTAAIAAAIDVCAAAGGGRVLIPAGRWLTGPIHLRSDIELHLAEGAVLVFSDGFEDYLPPVLVRVGGIELYNYSPLIYARGCSNLAITGSGRLDGNAAAWWDWKKGETSKGFEMGAAGVPVEQRVFGTREARIRPSFVSFVGCDRILLEGFTIGSGPNWTIHPVYCDEIIIRRVHVLTDGPNNDGIDPDSCRHMLIEHCVFDTGDDCVVLKSGYNEDGWRVNRPTENVVMRWCTSKRGHGGLVIGSEMSGDVRNVYMHDCYFEGTDRAVRIKSKRGRGGIVENVLAENLRVKDLEHEVVILNMDYGSDRQPLSNERAPLFRNVTVRNVVGEGAKAAVRIAGLPDSLIQNIRFENFDVAADSGVIAKNAQGLVFENVSVRPKEGPVYDLTDVREVAIRGGAIAAGTDTYLSVAGAQSAAITVENNDLSAVTRPVESAPEVPAEAVMVR